MVSIGPWWLVGVDARPRYAQSVSARRTVHERLRNYAPIFFFRAAFDEAEAGLFYITLTFLYKRCCSGSRPAGLLPVASRQISEQGVRPFFVAPWWLRWARWCSCAWASCSLVP